MVKGSLAHTQFVCLYCESAHLSFTERCPHCHHENVAPSPFLHCFTCGLIAPESEFISSGTLKCPKCASLLRHVGEDYDRPLESGQCFNCQQYYQEAELWTQCMLCEKAYEPEKLAKSHIHTYQVLTENCEPILQTYFIQNLSVFDEIHYIEPPFFMAMLDWLLTLNQRYSDEAFGLIGLKLSLSPASLAYVHPFAEQLKLTLRKTDLLTRILEDEIWLVLPKTDEAGLKITLERIQEIKAGFPAELHWQIASITSSKISKESTIAQVMAQMRANWK